MWTTQAVTDIPPCRLLPRGHAQFFDGHVLNRGTQLRSLNLTGSRIKTGDTVTIDYFTMPCGRRIHVIVAKEFEAEGHTTMCGDAPLPYQGGPMPSNFANLRT